MSQPHTACPGAGRARQCRWRIVWPLFALMAAAVPAVGQSSAAGIIAGTVRDTSGVPVPGVQVTTRRADGSYERRDVSANDGTFRLAALPPGSYDVMARRLGFRPVITTGVAVSAATVTTIDVTLEPSAQSLAPVVVQRAAVLPGRETEVSPVRVDARQIAQLPVGLDLERLVALTPGARPNQMWGGAGYDANAYRLDGVAIDHPGFGGAIVQPSVHWIEQLEVRGLGAGADQGGFQGGLVDIVTKSGSNTRRSQISANLEDAGLNASNLSGTDIVPELAGRRDVAVETGGPLVRDRLFYFAAGQWARTHERALDHLGAAPYSPVQKIADSRSAFAKLTWTPSVHDLINVGIALGDSATDHAGLTGRETATATSRVRSPSTIIDGSWQRTIGARTILEANVVGFSATVHDDPYAGPGIPGVATYQLGTSQSYQNAAFQLRQHPTSLGFTLTADHFMHGWGDHHLRLGTEQVSGGWQDDRTRNAGMTWRPRFNTIDGSAYTFRAADASTWQAQTPTGWGGETHVQAHVKNGAVFLQDDYTRGRIGIHPGVRYGWWSGTIDRYRGGPPIHALSTNGLDPRIGLTVDLGTDRLPLGLTAHWGRYHQDLFAQMFDRVSGTNAYSNYEVWEYGGPAFSDPTRVLTVAQRDSMAAIGQFRPLERDQLDQTGPVRNYHQPFVDQFVVGLHADPTTTLHLEAAYIARDNRNIVALVDRNEATNYIEADSVIMIDHFGRPVADYIGEGNVLVIPKVFIPKNAVAEALADGLPVGEILPPGTDLTWNPQYEITNPAGARRRFRQLQVNAAMHHANWDAWASLAISSLRGNFSTVSGYDPNSVTGFDRLLGRGPGPYVRPNEMINYGGELDNASHTELKLRAIGDIWRGFRGGIVVNTVSGDRLTPSFNLQPYAYLYLAYGLRPGGLGNPAPPAPDTLSPVLFIPLAGQRINLAPTGSYHYAGHMTVDLHLEHPLRTRGVEWTVQVDAFNVLGSKAVTLINTSLDASTDPNSLTKFASPLGRVQPRTLRIGTSAAW
jgi:Carboxypeptidase regulatory-like domain